MPTIIDLAAPPIVIGRTIGVSSTDNSNDAGNSLSTRGTGRGIRVLRVENAYRGLFFEAGLDLELDFDFQVDVGVEMDDLALPGEVKLDFLYRKSSSKKSS